ncbi:MAG: hypothetical protein IPG61_15145 [bacterium]|nr:hypothetical protein [bacterium]
MNISSLTATTRPAPASLAAATVTPCGSSTSRRAGESMPVNPAAGSPSGSMRCPQWRMFVDDGREAGLRIGGAVAERDPGRREDPVEDAHRDIVITFEQQSATVVDPVCDSPDLGFLPGVGGVDDPQHIHRVQSIRRQRQGIELHRRTAHQQVADNGRPVAGQVLPVTHVPVDVHAGEVAQLRGQREGLGREFAGGRRRHRRGQCRRPRRHIGAEADLPFEVALPVVGEGQRPRSRLPRFKGHCQC